MQASDTKPRPASSTSYPRKAKASLDEIRFIWELIKKGETKKSMVDVGAHHGTSFARFLNQGWRVLAFEPDSTNRKLIELTFGKHAQLEVSCKAAYREDGQELEFYTSEVSTGISSLNPFHASHVAAQKVETVTLNTALTEQSFGEIGFLKVDVEGHEMDVLEGFDLSLWSPDVIMLEYEDRKSQKLGYTTIDLITKLAGQGYSVFLSEFHPVIEYGQSHDWRCLKEHPCELSSENWGNIIAFKKRPPNDEIDKALRKALRFRSFGVLHCAYPRWLNDNEAAPQSLRKVLAFQIFRSVDDIWQGWNRCKTLTKRLRYYLHKDRTTFSPSSRTGS